MGFRSPLARAVSTGTGDGAHVDVRDDRVQWHTGDPEQTRPGELYAGIRPGGFPDADQAYVYWTPPELNNLPSGLAIRGSGKTRTGTFAGQWTIDGDVFMGGVVQAPNFLKPPVYDLVLEPGWVWFGSGWSKPRAYVDIAGTVHVQGFVKKVGTVSTGSKIATLRAEHSPLNGTHPTFVQSLGSDWLRLDVNTAGDLVAAQYNAASLADGTYFGLDIHFRRDN